MLSGNGDLHLENLALLGAAGAAGFSPVYDPAPMRAYRMHDLLCAVPFGGYGEEPHTGDPLRQALRSFAGRLALGASTRQRLIREALEVTADYPQRVQAVTSLPEENRMRLIAIFRDIRQRLQALD